MASLISPLGLSIKDQYDAANRRLVNFQDSKDLIKPPYITMGNPNKSAFHIVPNNPTVIMSGFAKATNRNLGFQPTQGVESNINEKLYGGTELGDAWKYQTQQKIYPYGVDAAVQSFRSPESYQPRVNPVPEKNMIEGGGMTISKGKKKQKSIREIMKIIQGSTKKAPTSSQLEKIEDMKNIHPDNMTLDDASKMQRKYRVKKPKMVGGAIETMADVGGKMYGGSNQTEPDFKKPIAVIGGRKIGVKRDVNTAAMALPSYEDIEAKKRGGAKKKEEKDMEGGKKRETEWQKCIRQTKEKYPKLRGLKEIIQYIKDHKLYDKK